MLITNGEPDTRRRVSPVPREGVGNLLFDMKEQGAFTLPYDLLQNYTATTMLANSEFVALLKQANTDSSKMAEVIGVSEAQLRFVTNTQSGMGLMKCGNVVIPFDNTIEKGTDLYNLYNTNIHEKIAMEKRKNAVDNG